MRAIKLLACFGFLCLKEWARWELPLKFNRPTGRRTGLFKVSVTAVPV